MYHQSAAMKRRSKLNHTMIINNTPYTFSPSEQQTIENQKELTMKLTITHTSSLGRHAISNENGANFIDVYGPEITGLSQEYTDNVASLIVAAPDFISCCETPFDGDMTPLEDVAALCADYERVLSLQEQREDPSAEDDLVASVRRFVANMRAAYAKAKGIDINDFENGELE